MSNTTSVLLVEDEKDIRKLLRTLLERAGHAVFEACAVQEGLVEASRCKPDIVILDLGFPDGEGVHFIRDFRHWSKAPILVLSARTAEKQKVAALDAGADDYLVKPFVVDELLARVRALRRRMAFGENTVEQAVVSFSDVVVDFSLRAVSKAGEPVHLTPIEYRLLALLLANAGKVLTHRHLLREIWGATFVESNHYLRIYVGHLRQKLEDDPAQPRHFITETAVGYRFQY